MTEYIDIIPGSRLAVIPDDSPECPRGNWQTSLTGFVTIRDRGDSRLIDVPAEHEPVIPIAEAHDRFDAGRYAWRQHPDGRGTGAYLWWDNVSVEDRLIRWASVFHDTHLEYDSEHGGYWFVDRDSFDENWTPIATVEGGGPLYSFDGEPRTRRYVEEQVIAQEQETYRQWAEGEVYGVVLERAVTYAKVEHRGSDGETWHLVNPLTELHLEEAWVQPDSDSAIWGCYLDDKYTAQVVALEYFDLTEAEAAALTPKGA